MRSLIFLLLVSFNATAALSIRDLDGDWSNGFEGVYDDVLDITWLQDANYAQTSGFDADGRMSWTTASNWVDGLTVGGYQEWRLPTTLQPDLNCEFQDVNSGLSSGYGCSGSEMGNLYYLTLGNESNNVNQTARSESGPFTNILNEGYWSSTEYSPNTNRAWYFGWSTGPQRQGQKNSTNSRLAAWPVHDGDIGLAPVPLPAGIYLFLSGLVGLVGVKLRGRNA